MRHAYCQCVARRPRSVATLATIECDGHGHAIHWQIQTDILSEPERTVKHALLLAIATLALTGCNPPKFTDTSTRVYACPRGANPGSACKGELVYVGNMYVRVDEEAARIQIHAEPMGNSGLLGTGTIAFRDCKIQNRLNWSCDEGRSMTSYYLYTMKNGIMHASWASPGNAQKIQIAAVSGANRWLYRFGLKKATAELMTQHR